MKLVIIGGVAGGASAATRARRLDDKAEIVLVERGPDVSFANCGLPYHIGGEITSREALLVAKPEQLSGWYRLDVRTRTEARAIDAQAKTVRLCNLATGEEYDERYDALILSPGAAPVRPPLPGIASPRVLTLRNLPDMDRIIEAAKDATRAVVVGGGYIGLEMAENLRERGLQVTLVELTKQVMGPADPEIANLLHDELRKHGVDLRLGTSVTAFEDTPGGVDVRLSTGDTVAAQLAIMAVGVKPETTLAVAAGVALGKTGGIRVDERMRTSVPDIYAVGDAIEVPEYLSGTPSLVPLAGPANRQGRIAADTIFGQESAYQRTLGTAICKVFDLAVGMTGLSEKAAAKQGIATDKVYVHPNNHAGYYPGATPIHLKLIFSPEDGKVLGAQAVGMDGVDKRIDVIATAIRGGMTVHDLEHLELSYAPSYGSAKDPVNFAGFVASNVLRGDCPHIHVAEFLENRPGRVPLDIRRNEEVLTGKLPGAIHIPLHELRDRLGELDREKEYVAFCKVGLRGYLATRILRQHGFRAVNLDGGTCTYAMVLGETACTPPAPKITPACGATCCDGTGPGTKSVPVRDIDACGLQCPGPIMQLKRGMDELAPGDRLSIRASDPGFTKDVAAWCRGTGNELISLDTTGRVIHAIVAKGSGMAEAAPAAGSAKRKMTNVVFSNDLDRAMASFIIANGAAAAGHDVTLFFTFWGLSLLRKTPAPPVRKNIVERMFGMMLPKGPQGLKLSKMHMAGMGTMMMNQVMAKKNVEPLAALLRQAQENGVKLVACTMTMDVMGLRQEELIDGVELGGVAAYVDELAQSQSGLFI
ncbi:MAG: FAD-dependent oxidoreductase [Lentisphaeria bacterium]|jgi:NADPH-dependent 2,4-dienoyl-CoA reductase/sulfur reductase-like enzyme/peroxiredoxin family protein/rhodanese-related sulfurtransferase/TusA-related sulfurtransferase|nr:FAD-dependent oxidoreductase [Lentisphaeria bacterium]